MNNLPFNAETFTAPAVAIAKLNVAKIEKLADIQFSTLRALTDLSVAQLKAAADVRDLEGLKAFSNSQIEVARTVAERVRADGEVVVEFAKQYGADVQGLVQESVEAVAAKPVAKPVAKKSRAKTAA